MKTLAEKIAVMQAAGRGEKIESTDLIGAVPSWSLDENPKWNWYSSDYRVAEKPIVAPDGYELVPCDSRECPQKGWMVYYKSIKGWRTVDYPDYASVSEFNHKYGYIFARPIVKRELKIPDGQVFWVRYNGTPDYAWVPEMINGMNIRVPASCFLDRATYINLEIWQWSPDRKTWYNFYGEKVQP